MQQISFQDGERAKGQDYWELLAETSKEELRQPKALHLKGKGFMNIPFGVTERIEITPLNSRVVR